MPILIEKNILWLEVSVEDIVIVQIFKCQNDLGKVELRNFLWETQDFVHVIEDLTSCTKLKDDEEIVFLETMN